MKRLSLTTSIFVSALLFSSTLFANTLWKENTISNVTTPYHWTGFYAGAGIGVVDHSLNMTDTEATSFNATILQTSGPDFTGGFQLGYRRQVDLSRMSGVYGIEFGANFSNATFNKNYGSSFALYQLSSKNELKNLLLLQLLGGIAADRTLLFLAAGLSWVKISGSTVNQSGAPFFNSFSLNKKILGTAIGGGIEYALTDKLSVRLKIDMITPNDYTTTDDEGDRFDISNSIMQGMINFNYKFA